MVNRTHITSALDAGSVADLGTVRLRVAIAGAVQGVGFRPFIYRLAAELGMAGWVNNSSQGVLVEIEGARPNAEAFLLRLETDNPPLSVIQSLEATWLDPAGHRGFTIRESDACGAKTALVLPDIATCADCLREIFDPQYRRHRYPFTNCTNCGPRFSIIESLPYDRANTSMKHFVMCPNCEAEYRDPTDRRFHAQPNACPVCGPQLALWDPAGLCLHQRDEALCAGAAAVRDGRIVAVKGMGGVQLLVAAHDDDAVRRLRKSKHREEKPFALMFPSLDAVKQECDVSPLEERLLKSPEAPIVLLRRRADGSHVSKGIAPGNPQLGAMLPYTPLHHLLMREIGFPIVATSGNLSDEPLCIDNQEALQRLRGIADAFLVHDRPIVRPVDDSVARVMLGREMLLRRARGYAPLPVRLGGWGTASLGGARSQAQTVLAVGGHLKNTVALGIGPQIFVSQHVGNLETVESFETFKRVVADLQRLYEATPGLIACDAHPEYLSTKFVRDLVADCPGRRSITVQHHMAHVLACMAENEVAPPALGVAWDGTGYGVDGTIWGGEFFHVTGESIERVAHLRPFRLPGGDKAMKEPGRAALGVLYEMFGDEGCAQTKALESLILKRMLQRRVNSPLSSSAGRLFDAIAAIIGLRQTVAFEGQAAMELEFLIDGFAIDDAYEVALDEGPASSAKGSMLIIDWKPLVEGVLADMTRKRPISEISAKFHNALVEAIVAVAQRIGEPKVVLSGGCFQNRYLNERTVLRLQEEGFQPYWHQRIPPNDGGIALGQVVAGLRTRAETRNTKDQTPERLQTPSSNTLQTGFGT